jgi:hypothetical protein
MLDINISDMSSIVINTVCTISVFFLEYLLLLVFIISYIIQLVTYLVCNRLPVEVVSTIEVSSVLLDYVLATECWYII